MSDEKLLILAFVAGLYKRYATRTPCSRPREQPDCQAPPEHTAVIAVIMAR